MKLAPLLSLALSGTFPASLPAIDIDGTRDEAYGAPLAVQTIETGFGNNLSEWNAAYGKFADGHLNLLFTGNLEANFNKLEIFIDVASGGSSVFEALPANDGSQAMAGMVFDGGFTPDFHLIARRGLSKFDLDIARLGTTLFSFHENVFGGRDQGSGLTQAGNANRWPIRVAYDNSNTAGIGASAGAPADQTAAAAVTTGLELAINLEDLDFPPGDVRVMLLQNNQAHDFLSNQSLGGLPLGTGNLSAPSGIDFNNFAGDQFFTVPTAPSVELAVLGFSDGNLIAAAGNVPPGRTFHLRNSTDGETFTPLPSPIDFDANTAQPFSVPGLTPTMLIQVFEGASP